MCITWPIHISAVSLKQKSGHTYECHTYEWAITHMNEPLHICVMCITHPYICVTTHTYEPHHSFIYIIWPIHMCLRTHTYVWHDFYIHASRAFLLIPQNRILCMSGGGGRGGVTLSESECDMYKGILRSRGKRDFFSDDMAGVYVCVSCTECMVRVIQSGMLAFTYV